MFQRPVNFTALALCAVLAFSVNPALAQEEDAPVDCENAMSQADMNQCSYEDFEKADKELNVVYKQALKSQQEMDEGAEEMGPGYVGAVAALKKAQRAWIDYRDGHCDGVGFEAVGGSMQPMLITGCKASMTTARTKELRELIEGQGN